jgi:hypothetical protein
MAVVADPGGKASKATSTSTDEICCAPENVHEREMASMCRAKDKIGRVVIGDGNDMQMSRKIRLERDAIDFRS